MADTDNSIKMTTIKPYLIRACYEWILDNNLTPLIAADTSLPEVVVPNDFYTAGQIVLNINPTATHNLRIGNDAIECKARFGGVSHDVFIPIDAVLAIYARENNQGMAFSSGEISIPQTASNPTDAKQQTTKPKFKIVDGGK